MNILALKMAFNFLLPLLEGFCVCMCYVFSDKLEMLVLCLHLEFIAEEPTVFAICEQKICLYKAKVF